MPDSEYDSLKARLKELTGAEGEEEKDVSKSSRPNLEGYMLTLRVLNTRDIPYADNTPGGGSLWIFDPDPASPLIAELTAATGLKFAFTAKGGAASGHKPAWYYNPASVKEGKRKRHKPEPEPPELEAVNAKEIADLRQRIATASGFYHVFHAPICDDSAYDSMKVLLTELEAQ